MRFRNYGDSAVLVELDTTDEAAALLTRLQARAIAGVVEMMPGLQTVLIRFDGRAIDARQLVRLISEIPTATAPGDGGTVFEPGPEVSIRVDYSGPDLDDVARHTSKTIAEVIAAHQDRLYRIVLIGMAPGFYFLAGGDPALRVPRRSSPRIDVGKGALGLAGEFTGIYPRTGPGGWQLIGRVVDELWHPRKIPAARLSRGTSIRFVAA